MRKVFITFIAVFFTVSLFAQSSFTPGNLVVIQTSGSVSKSGSPVTLREYTVNGVAGITVAIPATGATPLQMAAGPGGSEGFLTRSADGTVLMLAGYSTSTSQPTDITVTSSAAVPRVIFRLDAFGGYTQVGTSTTNYSGNDIRGAITDGTNYWASGASVAGVDGIDYYGPGAPAALAVSAKAYGLQIFGGQIYFSTQKVVTGVTNNFGIYALGSGTPTSGTITPTLIINTGTATPEDFSFNAAGDICYIAINLNSPAGGIQKWTKSAGVWSLAYTLSTGVSSVGAYGLAADYSGPNPVIYATSNEANTTGNRIIKITDTGAGSPATTLVTGAANTWYHGIAFTPTCPLPGQPATFTTSAAIVNQGQTGVTYTVPNDPSVTYTWTYSGTGATINGTGNSVMVDFSSTATGGTLSVKASNACGLSAARTVAVSIAGTMRITEYMYSGINGEFIEFTNVGGTSVDMTGWSSDDATRTPGGHNLSAFGVVQPGESVILTETDPATFRTAWHLCAGIKIIGPYTNDNLGRSDEINLYNGTTLIDRLTFNDQGTGTVKGPRAQNASAWVPAIALGANNASQWILSAVSDAEGSFTSAGNDIGSPGKSTRATVSFDPCFVVNGAPSIVMNVATTTNYLDGGVTIAPISPYGVSGVISDPTDPAGTLGIDFTINDSETPVDSLTVTATSSNTSVVPNANITLTGSGASRNLKITPASVGYSNITVTVNDGTNNTSYVISYAASAASATPASTLWHTGLSDASDAIALDDNYYITGDDEVDLLNVYARSASGLPVASYDFSTLLNLPDPTKPEVDVEAATRSASIGNRVYWMGSMSNGKAPFPYKANRDRLFATTVNGTGATTSFSMVGYGAIRSSLIAWGDAHGYNFTPSAADGVDSKTDSGFAAEGMVFAPDNTTLYIGMRAPLVPSTARTKAVIAPITNFETWFNNGAPSGDPTYGAPIELDMGGRGVRDLIRLSNGTYVILAGDPGGAATSALYKWTGNATDAPVLVNSTGNGVLNMEGALQVNEGGQLSLNKLRVISDGGDVILYNDGAEAKDFADLHLRKFRSDSLTSLDLTLCQPTAGDTTVTTCNSFTWYDSTYTATPTITPKHTFINASGCDSIVTLHLTINHSTTSDTSVTANNSYTWNGVTYTLSGTYTKTGFTNAARCDSTATLFLTIVNVNQPPLVKITYPGYGYTFNAGSDITVQVQATDSDGSVAKVELFVNGSKLAEDSTAPYAFSAHAVEAGIYMLTAKATDNNGATTISDTVTVVFTACGGSGSITAEGYVNIPGSQVADLTSSPKYPNSPDVTATLNKLEYGPNYGDNYGARVRGYICAPVTGNYTFYIAGDDQDGVWLSTDENPANKVLIAYNETRVNSRAWYTYPTQKSVSTHLIKGARYYIETLHKEGTGNDYLAVAWQIPGGAFEAPIPGSRLSPYSSSFPGTANQDFAVAMQQVINIGGLKAMATPNPSADYFTVTTRSAINQTLSIMVTDATGRILERRASVAPNGSIQLGNRLSAGIYFVEIIQGSQRQRIKLVKQ